MRKGETRTVSAFLAAALTLTACGQMFAQAPAPGASPAPAKQAPLATLWEDFIHYILLARADAAESNGKAILAANPDPKKLYYLWVKSDRAGAILARARRMNKALAAVVDRLSAIINDGAKAVRTDPAEIARWIEMLGAGPREYLIGMERLVEAGEYAVPQMVNALVDVKTSEVLRQRLVDVLPRLGKSAVRPLVEALVVEDDAVKEVICRALGKIGYAHAAAYLKELAEKKGLAERTKTAALGAVAACAGRDALKKAPAELFYELAEKYYRGDDSVSPDPRFRTGNVWYWQRGLGLTYKVAPVEIFNEIYAMRAARKVLQHDPTFYPAVPLWLSAYIRKEAKLPPGAKDPTHQAGEPGAEYYALASGAKFLQAVLARAVKDGDRAVALRAISALSRTAGAENLVQAVEGGVQPLVQALGFPDREVRYLAAVSLAGARPQKRFAGWHLVVPVLVEALRQSGSNLAIVSDPDQQRRNRVKDLLRAAKYQVADAKAFGQVLQAARTAGGVDLVVLSAPGGKPDFAEAVAMLRAQAAVSKLPVIVVAPLAEQKAVEDLAARDPLVKLWPAEKLDAATLNALLESLRTEPGGRPLTDEQSAEWAIRAARTLGMLAETNNPVFDLTDATASLVAALKDPRDPVRIAVAQALAQFNAPAAQRALADLADDASAEEQVRLAAYAALSASVRRFGNELTEDRVDAIISTVRGGGDLKIREAAAQVLGALALPSEKITGLILSAK